MLRVFEDCANVMNYAGATINNIRGAMKARDTNNRMDNEIRQLHHTAMGDLVNAERVSRRDSGGWGGGPGLGSGGGSTFCRTRCFVSNGEKVGRRRDAVVGVYENSMRSGMLGEAPSE